MATTLTIDGVNKANLVNWQSVQREEVLTKESNKLRFRIKKHDGQTYKPLIGDEVVLTINSVKEFGGFITEMHEVVDGRVEYIECICKDYTQELDRLLVATTFENQTVNQIVASLLSTFAPTFGDDFVDCPVTIDKVTFNYLPVSRCLEKLTELAGNYEWYVDYNKQIHFFEAASMTAPFSLSDTSGNYYYNTLDIRQDTHQLRNRVIIRGGLITDSNQRTEFLYGNGSQKLFPLASKFATVPAVSVNGSSVTVGVDFLDEDAAYFTLWNYNEKYLRFVNSLTTGTTTVIGYPQYPLIFEKSDEESIETYGVYEHVIVDKNITDLETAGLRADAELLRYAIPAKTATFDTEQYGLQTGQTLTITSTIRGIDDEFKIQSIKSRLKTPNTDELIHSVEAVTADDLGINDILAQLLIKNPSDQIDIEADKVVSRINKFTDQLGIEDETPIAVSTTGPYTWGGFTWGFGVWNS